MQIFVSVSPIAVAVYVGVVLVAILTTFLRKQELPSRLVRWGLFGTIALLVIRGTVYGVMQYQAFESGLLRFIPTRELLLYSIQYSLLHYFSGALLSACIGGMLLLVMWFLQRRSHGQWLDTNERILVAFGALAAGWPGAILYAMGVFLLPLLVTPWLVRNVHERRVRLAPFIILSALLAMAVTPFVLPYASWLQALVCRTCL